MSGFIRIDGTSGMYEENVLLRDCIKKFRTGYVNVPNGNVTMPVKYVDCHREILDYDVRDDDVFVVSFPKTGTTWTQELVWLLGNNMDYERAEEILMSRFPFLEVQVLFEPIEEYNVLGPIILDSLKSIEKLPSPRFIKTHLPWQLLPKKLTNGKTNAKIIYIWRNVKDCLVSYYHYCVLMEDYQGNFDDYFKMFLASKLSYTPFWSHVLEFWKRRDRENILVLTYEELKSDLLGVIKRVASFLNKQYSEEQYLKLAQHLSFESMKNNPSVNYEPVLELNRKTGLMKSEGKFMRSGTIGNFKVHMTPEQIEQIDEWTKEQLKDTGLNP